MKNLAIVFCFALIFLGFAKPDKNRQVLGKVLQTFEYCGGAEPDPEQMKEMNKPRPFANKKCYIRKGKTNYVKEPIVASFTSDSAGGFMIYLPPGDYCIVDSRKYDKNFLANIAKKYKKKKRINFFPPI